MTTTFVSISHWDCSSASQKQTDRQTETERPGLCSDLSQWHPCSIP